MMKKTILLFSLFSLLFSSMPICAQTPDTASEVSTIPVGPEKVGIVANMKGGVEIRRPGKAWRIAVNGQPLFMGDGIKTDAEGKMEILLPDQTTFKIGPNSAIIVDEFFFDTMTAGGKPKSSITKGVFRYVSGKIGPKDAENGEEAAESLPLG